MATATATTGFDTETAELIAEFIAHRPGITVPGVIIKHALEVGSGVVPLNHNHVLVIFTSASMPVVKAFSIGEQLSPTTALLEQFTGTAEIIEDGPYRWAQHDDDSIIFACPHHGGLDGIFFLTEDPKLIGDIPSFVAGIRATKQRYGLGE